MDVIEELQILLVSSYLPVGGGISAWTEKYMKYLTNHMIKFDLIDLGFVGKRTLYRKDISDEVRRTIGIIRSMKKAVNKGQYNICHINTSCSRLGILRDAWCAKIAYKKKIPVVLHCRCTIADQLNGYSLSKTIFKYLCNISDEIITLNQASFEFANEFARGKTCIIPNFIENDYCKPKELTADVVRKILFVGHVRKEKGVKEIIQAAEKLPTKEFILIGPCSQEIQGLTIPNNIYLLGNLEHDEVREYYRKADLFLFPSYSEGFANVMLEAMASSLPIIATDVGSNKSMIEEQGGIIIPTNDSQAIIDAICKLEDKKIRMRMSEWNYKKIKQYSVENVMERLLALYMTIIRNNNVSKGDNKKL